MSCSFMTQQGRRNMPIICKTFVSNKSFSWTSNLFPIYPKINPEFLDSQKVSPMKLIILSLQLEDVSSRVIIVDFHEANKKKANSRNGLYFGSVIFLDNKSNLERRFPIKFAILFRKDNDKRVSTFSKHFAFTRTNFCEFVNKRNFITFF